jgi:hypothetical protein
MAVCLPITTEKIRAEVYMGDSLIAKTPFVSSFNIQEARSQISATCSVTLVVEAGTIFPLGEQFIVKAGTRGNLVTRFTGEIEQTSVKPDFGRPSYFNITLSCRGVLSVLEGKTFSRRLPPNSEGVYCMITEASSNTVDKFKALDKPIKSGNHTFILESPNPASGKGENSGLIVHNKSGTESTGKGGFTGSLASPPKTADNSGAGSLGIHDHSDLDNGGPAFGVYSSD